MKYVKCTSCSEWITKEELFKNYEKYLRDTRNWGENVIKNEMKKYENDYYVWDEIEVNSYEELEAKIMMDKLSA